MRRKDEKNIMGIVNVKHNKNVFSNLFNKTYIFTHIYGVIILSKGMYVCKI